MNLIQCAKFQPITIVLETKEEAEALWKALRVFEKYKKGKMSIEERNFVVTLSNWFSNQASL